jgi:aspartyl-tRNA(Asn)/glutamyl-tRNA(Gln) amidotransferase subunit A
LTAASGSSLKPPGSRGGEAVASALAVLAGYRPARVERRPAFDVRLPGGPADPSANGFSAAAGPAGGGGGSIVAACAELRSGATTSGRLIEEALEAVERRDPDLGAVVHLMADEAAVQAARLDAELAAGRDRGPLHGIPMTVKDIIHVAGAPTRAGSAVYEQVPRVDAEAVARLRAAGAVVIAKVSTHEFALGVTTPQSRNPHDQTRIPGGSSGGSAIAVSTGMGLASLATDTRASIRVPAAFCGVVGLKPTYGAVPTSGIVPNSWTMDHIGPLAPTVADAATVLEVLTGGRSRLRPWVGSPVAGMRIGVPIAAFADIEPGVEAGVQAAIAAAEALGCAVTEARRPTAADLDDSNAAGMIVSRCEAATFHRSLGADRSQYWEEVADQLEAAAAIGAIDYLDAQRLRADLTEGLLAAFEHHDVLAMPTVPVVAPHVEDFARYLLVLSRNTTLWSLTGFPAISVPCGTADGLPFAIQLVAPPWREDLLIALGSALEVAVPAARLVG